MSTDSASSSPIESPVTKAFTRQLDLGPQPLDGLMREHGLENHHLVVAIHPQPLTHKAVQRARKGRRLTIHMKTRLTHAFNAALKSQRQPVSSEEPALAARRDWFQRDLFNY
jgi:hypothetical protein